MKKKSILLLPLILFGMVLAGCHGKQSSDDSGKQDDTPVQPSGDDTQPGGDTTPSGEETIRVSSVSVTPASLNLEVGDTGTLTATVMPVNATNKTVAWSSSAEGVASVANGVVTAHEAGNATITATADGKSGTCAVTVTAKDPGPGPQPPQPGEDVYKVQFGTAAAITLTAIDKDVDDAANMTAKYKGTSNVEAGQAIQFTLNGEAIKAGDENQDGQPHNGNNTAGSYDAGYTVHNDAENADIYLKVYDDGGYSFWLTGYDAGTPTPPQPEEKVYKVQFGDAAAITLTAIEKDSTDPASMTAKYKGSANVVAGQAIQFMLNDEVIRPGDENVDGQPHNGNNTAGDWENGYTVHNDAEADVYLKAYEDGGYSFWLTGYDAGTPTPPEPEEKVYKVQFGTAAAITLAEVDKDPDDAANMTAKFKGTTSVEAGQEIKFMLNDEVIRPGDENVDGQPHNGNNTAGDWENGYTVHNDAVDADVYLKVYEDGYSFWLTGYEDTVVIVGLQIAYTGGIIYVGDTVDTTKLTVSYLNNDASTTPVEAAQMATLGIYVDEACTIAVPNGAAHVFTADEVGNVPVWFKIGDYKGTFTFVVGYEYQLEIGTTVIEMTDDSTADKGEDTWVEQWKATVSATAGQVITFKHDGQVINPGAGSIAGNNVAYDETEHTLSVVQDATDETLYLKVYSEGYSVWFTGYSAPKATNSTLKVVFATAVPNYVDLFFRSELTSWDDDVAATIMTPNAGRTEFTIVIAEAEAKEYGYKVTAQAHGDEHLSWDADKCITVVSEGSNDAKVTLATGADAVVTLKTFESNPNFGLFNPDSIELYFRDAQWWNNAAASTKVSVDGGEPEAMTHIAYVAASHYNYWKIVIPDDAVKVQFERYKDDGTEYWGAKTVEVTLADRGSHDMYDISETSEAWESASNYVTGVWADYDYVPTVTYSLTITLTLETVPTNNVSLIYDVNGSIESEWINDKGAWNSMNQASVGVYTYTISGLSEGDVVRYCFATWLEGEQNFFLSGSADWKPASVTMGAENKTVACSADAFPASTDATVVFTVA